MGKVAIGNKNKAGEIGASKLDSNNKDDPQLPSGFNSGFIQSVLEETEIPLIVEVNGLSYLNYIELSLVISIFSLLFINFIIRKITNFILNLIKKINKKKKILKIKKLKVLKIKKQI